MQIESSKEVGGTAIVTGGNGFIGAHLIRELLARSWSVWALGRGKAGIGWRERLEEAMREAGNLAPDSGRLQCLEADLGRRDLGLGEVHAWPRDGRAVLIHLAADTKFVTHDPAGQRQVNVDATANLVRCLRPWISRMVHVSTAYVAGDRAGLIREAETDVGQGFNNDYERTKLEAEVRVRSLCEELQLPLVMTRPPIIVNDTIHGRSSTFTHLNVMVEVVNRIQEFHGIKDGEVVSRAIRVLIDPMARPNLVPVDVLARVLALAVEAPSTAGKTFHLCHPAPQANAEILDLIAEVFGVKGKVGLEYVRKLNRPVTRTEEMIARSFKVYLPYLNCQKQFDLINARAAISGYDALFAPLDMNYLQKVVAFERAHRGGN